MSAGSFTSSVLGVETQYACLLPAGYDALASTRYAVIYMLHGLGGAHTDWLENTRLRQLAATRPFIFILPSAGTSWYCDAYDGSLSYERYFVEDLIPHVEQTYRAMPARSARGLIGLSMGGFGAIKLALQYPQLFAAAASHSGALRPMPTTNANTAPHRTFGDCRSNAAQRERNDPFALAAARAGGPIVPALYFDCGLNDPLIEVNRRFHERLIRLGVPHEYREYAGYHTWPYWNRTLRYSLAFMDSCLAPPSDS